MGRTTKWGYGWLPDLPDPRDFRYAPDPDLLARLPHFFDLRKYCPPVYNQLQINGCTANAVAAAFQFDRMKKGLGSFTPSRLFLYYNERSARGVECADCGSTPREGIKAIARFGDCPEEMWPYDVKGYSLKPSRRCYRYAKKHRAVAYHRLKRDLDHFRGCIASGYPFVFGFTVHAGFESFNKDSVRYTGRLEMPRRGEKVVGGHAVVAVGFSDAKQRFIVRNSFGRRWGSHGHFTIPYEYLLTENLSADFWTIRAVT